MKVFFSLLFLCFFMFATVAQAQPLRPYVLGAEAAGGIGEAKDVVRAQLGKSGLKILGAYVPAEDSRRYVFVVTSSDLLNAVKAVGGLTGFAAALRVAVTEEGGKVLVSYTNPSYWGNAYFREDFSKVKKNYDRIEGRLKKAMDGCGKAVGTAFGSEDGLSAEDLQDYSYMVFMPEFDDTNVLKEFTNYKEAVSHIDGKLKKGVKNVSLVYSVEIPGKELKLYGFGLSGPDGESDFLPTIDIANPKHTAFLPYECLVMGNEVHMLHGRFRIALSFPDLTMGTFTKIMSTPGDIEDLLISICR